MYCTDLIRAEIIQTMYSSCPNIIRHFVPLQFSQATIDHATATPLISATTRQAKMPFTNMKLKSLKNKPKDYILVFKNKTYKDYSPRKKVRYSSLIKEMQVANMVAKIEEEAQWGKVRPFSQIEKKYGQKDQKMQPRLIQSMGKSRDPPKELTRAQTCHLKRRSFSSHFSSSSRENRVQFKSSKESGEVPEKAQIGIENLVKFKIRGCKAPKQEIIDFFKHMKLEMNYKLAQRLVK